MKLEQYETELIEPIFCPDCRYAEFNPYEPSHAWDAEDAAGEPEYLENDIVLKGGSKAELKCPRCGTYLELTFCKHIWWHVNVKRDGDTQGQSPVVK